MQDANMRTLAIETEKVGRIFWGNVTTSFLCPYCSAVSAGKEEILKEMVFCCGSIMRSHLYDTRTGLNWMLHLYVNKIRCDNFYL